MKGFLLIKLKSCPKAVNISPFRALYIKGINMNKQTLLQLDGFDMLGQLSNVRHSINAQGRTETFYNVLPSYALFHVTWRLNKKPKSEENEKIRE